MATQILAVGTTAANSADIVVGSGSSLLIGLKEPAAGAEVKVSVKDDAGNYLYVGSLNVSRSTATLSAPGTYRLSRVAGASCGVFSA